MANEFLPFGIEGGANVSPQAAWDALPARSAGFSSGVAPSAQVNKALRQSAFMAHILAQVASDLLSSDSLDNGDTAAMLAKIKRLLGASTSSVTSSAALTAAQQGVVYVDASGGSLSLTLPSAAAAGGALQRFTFVRRDATANTVTLQPSTGQQLMGVTNGTLTIPRGGVLTVIADGASLWLLQDVVGFFDYRVLSAPGTTNVTVPLWAKGLRARAWGGGGGGGGANSGSFNAIALGGGGGGYAEGVYSVEPGQVLSCTVGAEGAGGSASPLADGGYGGTSSVGSLLSAAGGVGGGASGGGAASSGGTGGAGTGGQLAYTGGPAQPGTVVGGSLIGAIGGWSFCAGYNTRIIGAGSFAGNDGIGPGQGGNGAIGGSAAGGDGAPGLILLDFLA